jgi:predicted O-linked N-acetylglucosamine transferase (SPINDLY family)
MIGRNDPCPCKSGKKYKHCCQQKTEGPVSSLQGRQVFCSTVFQTALARHQAGDLAQAKRGYERILEVDPDHAEALHLLGVIAHQLGKSEVAVQIIGKALAIEPGFAEAHSNFGNALVTIGQVEKAAESFRTAIRLKPGFADAHCYLGNALRLLGLLDDAAANCRIAIKLRPEYADAHIKLGDVLKAQGKFEAALACYTEAIRLQPESAETCSSMGDIQRGLGNMDEAIACYRHALRLKPDFDPAESSLLFSLNFSGRLTPAECAAEAHKFGQRVAQKVRSRFSAWPASREPQRLRVGMVSGDLHRHPVAYFLQGLLANIDRGRFELIAYHANNRWDDVTERLRPQFDDWKLIARQSDEAAAHTIYDDGIHVLLDLSGHTARNRLPMFAWKPAPVQASWLGYFATTGLAEMDYALVDPYVAPPGEEAQFTESVWRLPESYLCFSAPAADINVGVLPALAAGHVTFGSFNNLAKMNDAVVTLWARVLQAVPGSRLFLKTRQLFSEASCETTRQRFQAHGIAPGRLILEGSSPRHELLAAYHRVDIALDPFPYPGGTTSVEAMWMGVPVITRRGDRFLSHVGESIACNAGLPECIARDDADYVAKSAGHASNLELLAALRSNLRAKVMGSPLFDAPRFSRNFEAALWGMWEHHCDRPGPQEAMR